MEPASEAGQARVHRLYLTAVVLPIALAAFAAAWFAWQVERISQVTDWIDSSDRVIALSAEAQRLVLEQEMAVRSFYFTRDARMLERYRAASPDEDLNELESLLANQPAQAAEIHALREVHRAFAEHVEEAIESPSAGQTSAGLRSRMAAIDDMRKRSAAIVASEKRTRLAHTRRFEKETRVATIGAVSLLALLAGAASISSRRQIRLILALVERERAALARAQEALQAKDNFLTNLSHELRTPLTPVLACVSVLRARRIEGAALDRALALIEKSAKAEAKIVDEVLDISRINAGKLRISPTVVDPAAAVRAAIDVVELSARAKGISIQPLISSDLPTILGDPARIQQVAWILLGNAIKFTPPGGRVEIALDRCDGGVRLRVTDDGSGIAADFLPQLFQPFSQADPSIKRAHGGLGLGLAIVKHVVELHGGRVEARSEGPGRGATFIVTLPAAPPELEATPAASTPPPGPPRSTSLRGVRVLAVDDDPSALDRIATTLRAHGASVEVAASPADALGLLGGASVDVVAMDLATAGADDLVGAIRASSPLGRRPHTVALAKPFEPEAIVDAVARVVEGPLPG